MVPADIVWYTRRPRTHKNSLVLKLRVFLHRKANKVIMTMVTLIGKPVKSSSPSTNLTFHISQRLPPAPNLSSSTQRYPETHMPPPLTCLRDIPTSVPTTAAATDDDDGARCLCRHPESITDEDANLTLTLIDPHKWNNFCNEFLRFVTLFNTRNATQTNDNTDTMAATEVAASDARSLPDDNTIYNHDLMPPTDQSHHASTHTIPSIHGLSSSPNDINNEQADDDDRQQTSAGTITNECGHLATLSLATPSHDNEFFDYQSKLNDINDAINRMTQSWPLARTTTHVPLKAHCTNKTTTYVKHPAAIPHPTAEVEPFSPADNLATTPIVLSHWGEFSTEFPHAPATSFAQPTINSTTQTPDYEITIINHSDSTQPATSTMTSTAESCAHTTITEHPTVLKTMIHVSDQSTPPKYHTNVTFNPKPLMTMTRNTPNSTSKDRTPIAFKLTSIQPIDLNQSSEAVLDGLDRLSLAIDSYHDRMVRHNMSMTTTLQQLVQNMQELLEILPSEPSPNQLQHQPRQAKLDTVLSTTKKPTLLPPSTKCGTFPLPRTHALKLPKNHVPLTLDQHEPPCATPHPPHQQAPYKILVFTSPSAHLPSRRLPPLTRRTKENFRPP